MPGMSLTESSRLAGYVFSEGGNNISPSCFAVSNEASDVFLARLLLLL